MLELPLGTCQRRLLDVQLFQFGVLGPWLWLDQNQKAGFQVSVLVVLIELQVHFPLVTISPKTPKS